MKNEGKTLPLKLEAGQTVVLAGAGCNSLVRQGGGWTLHWWVCDLSYGMVMCVGLTSIHPHTKRTRTRSQARGV